MKLVHYSKAIMFFAFLWLSNVNINSQDFDARIILDSFNCETRLGYYSVEFKSVDSNFFLGSHIVRLFWDGSKADYVDSYRAFEKNDPNTLYGNLRISILAEHADMSEVNGNLSYEDNLSFLNAVIDLNTFSEEVATKGVKVKTDTWLTDLQLVLRVKESTINDPNDCLGLSFPIPGIYISVGISVGTWIGKDKLGTAHIRNMQDLSAIAGDPNQYCLTGMYNCNQTPAQEVCNDQIDNDGDGLVDCNDSDCKTEITSVQVTNIANCNSTVRGSITVVPTGQNLEYSKNGGSTYQSSNTFSQLEEGNYQIQLRNTTSGCIDILDSVVQIKTNSKPLENTAALCNDGIDNDCNGKSDCEETSCSSFSNCIKVELCNDQIDNDGDGLVDCNDSDCKTEISSVQVSNIANCNSTVRGSIIVLPTGQNLEYSKNGGTTYQSSNTFNQLEEGSYLVILRNTNSGCSDILDSVVQIKTISKPLENTAALCNDGIDNDCNGKSDCEETSCSSFSNCIKVELCNDQIDNDGDGLIDCNDSDCKTEISSVQVSNIANCNSTVRGSIIVLPTGQNLEYSKNGGTTYQSSNTFSQLEEGNYQIQLRNTTSGCIDILDSVVQIKTISKPLENTAALCNDGIDNDCNGKSDCEETSCSSFSNCIKVELCNDQIDNDGDGLVDCNDSDCKTEITSVQVSNIANCNSTVRGSIIVLPTGQNLEYSKNGGTTYQSSNTFNQLEEGSYLVILRNTNSGCSDILDSIVQIKTISKPLENTAALCNDGIDNDCNGKSDCEETSCSSFSNCIKVELCNDQIDNDGDGLVDCNDSDCKTEITSVQVSNIANCNSTVRGSIIVLPTGQNLEYSKNGGTTYQSSNTFNQLEEGSYLVILRNTTSGCSDILDSVVQIKTISKPLENTAALCNDGIDNDCDGNSDCKDSDCLGMPNCIINNPLDTRDSVDIGLVLKDWNCETKVACFTIQMKNDESHTVELGSQNWRLYYDHKIAHYKSFRLYDPAPYFPVDTRIDTFFLVDFLVGPIKYDDNLGYTSTNVEARYDVFDHFSMDAKSGWKDYAEVCYDIVDVNTTNCMSVDFSDRKIHGIYTLSSVVLNKFDTNNVESSLFVDQKVNYSDSANNTCHSPCNSPEVCNDQIDNDGDGLIDCNDSDCKTEITSAQVSNIANCNSTARGSIIVLPTGQNLEYSKNGGTTYQSSNIFSQLEEGSYQIQLRNTVSSCVDILDSIVQIKTINKPLENTSTLCNDGIDNDCNGKADCIEPSCFTFANCLKPEVCNDQLDNDGDGLVDCNDSDCKVAIDSVVMVEASCPASNDGSIYIYAHESNVSYKISNTESFTTNSIFTQLSPKSYNISIQSNKNACITTYLKNPLYLGVRNIIGESSTTTCDDGIDNDCDGKADCEDSGCQGFNFCNSNRDTIPKVDLRLVEEKRNCVDSSVCYFIQMKNPIDVDYKLGSQNWRLYYDAHNARFKSFSLINGAGYFPPETPISLVLKGENVNGLLFYEDSLGYSSTNVNIRPGSTDYILLPSKGDWINYAKVCYKITDPSIPTCMTIDFPDKTIHNVYTLSETELVTVNANGIEKVLKINSSTNYSFGDSSNCIKPCIKSEICSDGIDNDLDGKIDCNDTDCANSSDCKLTTKNVEIQLAPLNYDCKTGIAKFQYQIKNRDTKSISVANQNWQFYYDASVAKLRNIKSLNQTIFQPVQLAYDTVLHINSSNQVLDYQTNLGYVGFNISPITVNHALTILPSTEWTTLGELEFIISDTALENKDICFKFDWADNSKHFQYSSSNVIIQELLSNGQTNLLNILKRSGIGAGNINTQCFEDCTTTNDCEIEIKSALVTKHTTCAQKKSGAISITVNGNSSDYLYSIDSGSTFYYSPVFYGLTSGRYHVAVFKSSSNCTKYWPTTLVIDAPELKPEICHDGIDNDCDNLIDCADSDCESAKVCVFQEKEINVRLNPVLVDCKERTACYQIEIQNQEENEFINLGSQNWRLYYDRAHARVKNINSLLKDNFNIPTIIYDTVLYADRVNGPIEYEANLGYLSFNINQKSQEKAGAILPPSSNWYAIVEVCFSMDQEIIENPKICFHADWVQRDIHEQYTNSENIITEWVSSNKSNPIKIIDMQGIGYDLEGKSCFQKCTPNEICFDQIDNDYDGQIDENCKVCKVEITHNGDDTVCQGQSVLLAVDQDFDSYLWNTGERTKTIVVNPNQITRYSVEVQDYNGCKDKAYITLNVKNCTKIGDWVWNDLNNNSLQETYEKGIDDVKVVLYNQQNSRIDSTLTQKGGYYSFSQIAPGVYRVGFETPNNYRAQYHRRYSNPRYDSDIIEVIGNMAMTAYFQVDNKKKELTIDGGFFNIGSQADEDYVVGRAAISQTMQTKSSIYPNPTSSWFTLDLNIAQASKVNATLTDLTGKILKDNIINTQLSKGSHEFSIDLSSFSNGTYLLTIQADNYISHHKVIKIE